MSAAATEGSAQTFTYTNDNLPPHIDVIAEATLVTSERSGEHDEENPQQQREPAVHAEQMDKFSIYVCGRYARFQRWHLILLAAMVVAICVAVPVAVTSTNKSKDQPSTTLEQSKDTEQPSKRVGPEQGEGGTVLLWPPEVMYDLVVPSISHPFAFNASKSNTNPSPQQQAFHFLTLTFAGTWPEGEPLPNKGKTKFQEKIKQLYILAVLYYSTNGENWNNQYGFLKTEMHKCAWHVDDDEGKGIRCDEKEEMSSLDLCEY